MTASYELKSLADRAGGREVETPITCVITRFGLRSMRHAVPTYLDYRKVATKAEELGPSGLLRSMLLFENLATCYSVSMWEDSDAMGHFGRDVIEHVDVARRVLGRLMFDPQRGPELWSTKWRLVSVSHNLNWGDFDLKRVITQSSPDTSPRHAHA